MARKVGIAEATLRLRVKRDGLAAVQTEIGARLAQQEQSDALRLLAEQVMYRTTDRLEEEVERLESVNAMLRKRIAELEAELLEPVDVLRQRVAELEAENARLRPYAPLTPPPAIRDDMTAEEQRRASREAGLTYTIDAMRRRMRS